MTKFAIIGAGNAGCAFAAHLKLLGHETRLYDVVDEQLAPLVAADNVIQFGGSVELPIIDSDQQAAATIDYIGGDLSAAIEGAEIILCTTPAHTHRAVAKDLAEYTHSGQVVVLNPGRTCGAIEFAKVLHDNQAADDVTVVEAQTLLYACRRDGAAVHVFGVKDRVPCASIPSQQLDRFLLPMSEALPQFAKAEQGIWETSLHNIGMLFHPAPTLFNLARMESGQAFDYYHDGMTPTVAAMVERLDAERCQVGAAMGVQLPTVVQWISDAYGAEGASLFEAIQNNTSYTGIKAPQLRDIDAKRSLRYVVEDVPTGLVPVSELGSKLGVDTPNIDVVIDLASAVYERDFRAEGRTLERLGLAGMSADELRAL